MISTKDILKSFNLKLKELFPDVKIYGIETLEGYQTPCFNTEIEVLKSYYVCKHISYTQVRITADYFMTPINAVKMVEVCDTMRQNFLRYVTLEDRVFHISNFIQDYTGEYSNIPTFFITLDIYDNEHSKEITDPITNVGLNIEKYERR